MSKKTGLSDNFRYPKPNISFFDKEREREREREKKEIKYVEEMFFQRFFNLGEQ